MFTIETYQDVLRANGHRGHFVVSGWVVVAALAVAIVLFA